jgi:hypothetical protein
MRPEDLPKESPRQLAFGHPEEERQTRRRSCTRALRSACRRAHFRSGEQGPRRIGSVNPPHWVVSPFLWKIQGADPKDLSSLLCAGSERRRSEADHENDHEPDQSHGHLGRGRLLRSLAERPDAHQHCAIQTRSLSTPSSGAHPAGRRSLRRNGAEGRTRRPVLRPLHCGCASPRLPYPMQSFEPRRRDPD